MTESGLAKKFWADGVLVIEDYFDGALMDELDALIRGHFGADPDFLHSDEFLAESKTDVIPWFPQQDGPSPFDALDEHVGLATLTGDILGDDWRGDYCMVMFSGQGTNGQAWHQDCPPENPQQHNLNRLVYTADITDAIGGQTVVVPGSHRRGLLPAGDPLGHFPDEQVLRPRKGTLIMLHGHTWHRVLPITGAQRYSINYRAAPAGAPVNITDVCVYRNMRYRFSSSSVVEKRA